MAAESSQPASLPAFVFDDRHPCAECRNLSPMGRCLAAASPAMQRENVHRGYRPNPGILRRCRRPPAPALTMLANTIRGGDFEPGQVRQGRQID